MRVLSLMIGLSACDPSAVPADRSPMPDDTMDAGHSEPSPGDSELPDTGDTGTGPDPCALTAHPVLAVDHQLASELDPTATFPLTVPSAPGHGTWNLPDGRHLLWWTVALDCRDLGFLGTLTGATHCPDDPKHAVRLLVVDGADVRAVTSWPSPAAMGSVVSTATHGPVMLGASGSTALAVTLRVAADEVELQPLADLFAPLRSDVPLSRDYGADVFVPAFPLTDGRILWGETIQDLDPITPAASLTRLREADYVQGTLPERWPSRTFPLGDDLVVLTHDAGEPHRVPWKAERATGSWDDGTFTSTAPIGRASGLPRAGAVGGTPSTGDLLRIDKDGWIAVESSTDVYGSPIATALVSRDAQATERWSTPTLFEGPVTQMIDHPDGGWVLIGDDHRAQQASAKDAVFIARVFDDGRVAWRRPLPAGHAVLGAWFDPDGVFRVWRWAGLPGAFEPEEILHQLQEVELPGGACPGQRGLP